MPEPQSGEGRGRETGSGPRRTPVRTQRGGAAHRRKPRPRHRAGRSGRHRPRPHRRRLRRHHHTTILVVDDDPHALRQMRDALAAAGYAPVTAATPGEVARLIETRHPALAVLDLVLPGADGIELMRTLPALADIPVIFVSAYGRGETIAQALEAGAADYIVKPFSRIQDAVTGGEGHLRQVVVEVGEGQAGALELLRDEQVLELLNRRKPGHSDADRSPPPHSVDSILAWLEQARVYAIRNVDSLRLPFRKPLLDDLALFPPVSRGADLGSPAV